MAGGGLVLGWLASHDAALVADGMTLSPNAWLQIKPDGAIILQVDKIEMGQGVMTGYVTLLAEELDVTPMMISPQIAAIHPLFQDPVQLTGMSRSMATRWLPLRETGARARQMLLGAAAGLWQVDVATLTTDGLGAVIDQRGRKARYGELASRAALLPVPEVAGLREPHQYRWIGSSVPRPDVPAKVFGEARYGIDAQLPGMKVAVVLRSPSIQGTLLQYDAAKARQMPGVADIFPIHSGIAVIASGYWQARQAAAAVQAEWAPGPLAGLGTAAVRRGQQQVLDTRSGHRLRTEGQPDQAIDDADQVLAAEYWLPYLAHATMEPMNATVWFHDDGCEAWLPNQAPDMARQLICELADLPPAKVVVHSTYAGGGFGRRTVMDYVTEAAEIARQVPAPVKLVWSREDDIRHGLFREATLHRLRGGLNAAGEPVAWEHRLVTAGVGRQLFPQASALPAAAGATGMAYAIPNVSVTLAAWNPGVPIAPWRSADHAYTTFVTESFIDELAAAAGADPGAFRRQYLVAAPRLRAALDLVLEKSRWHTPAAAGRFRGVAIQEAFGTVVAQVAEVSVTADRQIRVHRVTCAVDCGTAINPDVVRQQMEGGIIFGLTAALYGEIHLENGAVVESNFHDYRMLRLAETPEIDVHIVPSAAAPSGVGEPGVPPIAPAVANALYAATGQRLRSLPLRLG